MEQNKKQQARSKWALYAVIAICAAPVLVSYLMYYVVKPQGRTNYGTLIDPRAYPIPALAASTLDGKPASLDALKGKWIMLQVGSGDCDEACRNRLFKMRQLRLMQGKEMNRIERVWLITDDKPIETMLLREYDGTHMMHANAQAIERWLPVDAGTSAQDHIYLIDPLGNLMMRFPRNADPSRVKRDMSRLLTASSIG